MSVLQKNTMNCQNISHLPSGFQAHQVPVDQKDIFPFSSLAFSALASQKHHMALVPYLKRNNLAIHMKNTKHNYEALFMLQAQTK